MYIFLQLDIFTHHHPVVVRIHSCVFFRPAPGLAEAKALAQQSAEKAQQHSSEQLELRSRELKDGGHDGHGTWLT
jgi:hypothetical protein